MTYAFDKTKINFMRNNYLENDEWGMKGGVRWITLRDDLRAGVMLPPLTGASAHAAFTAPNTPPSNAPAPAAFAVLVTTPSLIVFCV